MIKKILICLIILIIYIIGINQIPTTLEKKSNGNLQEKDSYGMVVDIGFRDSVSVSIKRPRFYGTIYEKDGNKDVKMFNMFNLPLKKIGFNFIWTHLLILLIIIFILFKRRSKNEKGMENFLGGNTYPSLGNYS